LVESGVNSLYVNYGSCLIGVVTLPSDPLSKDPTIFIGLTLI